MRFHEIRCRLYYSFQINNSLLSEDNKLPRLEKLKLIQQIFIIKAVGKFWDDSHYLIMI